MNSQPVTDAEMAEWKEEAGQAPVDSYRFLHYRILRLLADRERVERFLRIAMSGERGVAGKGRIAHIEGHGDMFLAFAWPHDHEPNFAEAIHAIQKGEEPK